jgi:hypothetical protein
MQIKLLINTIIGSHYYGAGCIVDLPSELSEGLVQEGQAILLTSPANGSFTEPKIKSAPKKRIKLAVPKHPKKDNVR